MLKAREETCRSLYYMIWTPVSRFQARNNISFCCLYCILLVRPHFRQFVISLVSHVSDEKSDWNTDAQPSCNGSVVFEELKFENWSLNSKQHETNKRQMHHWIRSAFWNFKLNSKCQLSSMSSCQSDLFSQHLRRLKQGQCFSLMENLTYGQLANDDQLNPSVRRMAARQKGLGWEGWEAVEAWVVARHHLVERKAVEKKMTSWWKLGKLQ